MKPAVKCIDTRRASLGECHIGDECRPLTRCMDQRFVPGLAKEGNTAKRVAGWKYLAEKFGKGAINGAERV